MRLTIKLSAKITHPKSLSFKKRGTFIPKVVTALQRRVEGIMSRPDITLHILEVKLWKQGIRRKEILP
jgi:hypothetical protein